ncbi:leucine-rich repeat protein [Butyrivibrio sp. AE2015]|uniref:leucine-rich repeat protein n=1 Tax=Butyrivibrio sp. AE2015 TaxID=1280663 RepID=UPI0003B42C4E|nr:leucine-rich repeat protein [Butyrivibrio sp. AE2015]
MKRNIWFVNLISVMIVFLLASCNFSDNAKSTDSKDKIKIIIEDNEDLILSTNCFETTYDSDLHLQLFPKDGYKISGCDYSDYDIERSDNYYNITLHKVKYSSVVSIFTSIAPIKASYCLDFYSFTDYPDDSHIKINTCKYEDSFAKDGYTLYAWSTSREGSENDISLGSRINKEILSSSILYGQWAKWTDPSLFEYEVQGDNALITGFKGEAKELVIPGKIDGKVVTKITENSFENLDIKKAILPPTIKDIENGAFSGCQLEEVILFDNIEKISDYSFKDCNSIKTLRINAASAPVYAGTYYATFPDKMDYLQWLSSDYPDMKKLVLFSGSSTRFGYDSPMLESAFPEYKVANMGVFAYTNALPQLDLILQYMNSGDILLDSPEFDASKRQFCVTNKFDDKFFNLIEEDYSLIEKLDLRNYTGVFSAFGQYLSNRHGIEEKSYNLSPSDYDENFNPIAEKSYNLQGDYCLYRPNAADDTPVYDLPVDYTIEAFPREYISSLNSEASNFTQKGIVFFFTYAPRNESAISDSSTPDKRKELDEYFRETLEIPVISDMEDSLFKGKYLFETDNHLSTEGVKLRTQNIINDLSKALTMEGD